MVKVSTKVTNKEKFALDSVAFKMKSLPLVIIYNIFIVAFEVVLLLLKSYSLAIVTAVVFVVFNGIIIAFRIKSKHDYKSKKKTSIENLSINYEFDEEKVLISFSSISELNKYMLNYRDISKVIVDEEYIYIFLNANNAFIIKKQAAKESDISYIQNVLKQKVKKFKIVK